MISSCKITESSRFSHRNCRVAFSTLVAFSSWVSLHSGATVLQASAAAVDSGHHKIEHPKKLPLGRSEGCLIESGHFLNFRNCSLIRCLVVECEN